MFMLQCAVIHNVIKHSDFDRLCAERFPHVLSTVWWAFVSARSSSAGVWSRRDCLRPDSPWRTSWDPSACERNTAEKNLNFNPKTEDWRKKRQKREKQEMERFTFRRRFSQRLSTLVIYHVLSEVKARRRGYRWNSYMDSSFKQLECSVAYLEKWKTKDDHLKWSATDDCGMLAD